MDKTIKKNNEFEVSSFIIFAMMMIANVCNYVFQVATGKLLSIEEYGVLNTLLSLFTIFSIPTTIISLISARYITRSATDKSDVKIYSVIRTLLLFVLGIAFIWLIVGLGGMDEIAKIFKIKSEKYIFFILLLSIISMINYVITGILQGLKKFLNFGIQSVIMAFCKLIFSCALILAGWNLLGVLTAILIGTILALLYGIKPIFGYVGGALSYHGINEIKFREFSKYAFGTFIAQGCIIAITNGDILLVKFYFSDKQAGIYSSAMVIGKIAMYVSSAVIAALFPLVVEKHVKKEDTRGLLKKAFLYGGGTCILCATGMILLGRYIIGILFGAKYLQAIHYLPAVCVFVVPLTLLTILMNYLLAIDEIRVFAITTVIAILCCLGITYFYHSSIMEIMLVCGFTLAVIFVVNIIHDIIKESKKSKN